MKRILLPVVTLISAVASLDNVSAQTQQPVSGVAVSDVRLERNTNYMAVEMNIDLRGMDVRGNRAVLLTPSLVNGNDTLHLRSVGVYSRERYYYYVRNGESMLTGADELSYRRKDMPSSISYSTIVPYTEWMNGAELILTRKEYGCCSTILEQQDSNPLGDYRNAVYTPVFRYMRPVAEAVKTRSLAGRAYVDFPVNRTELYPDYRNNRMELAKITATIDSVRNDKDITVTSITIKGFASPEGKYENNTRLAKGRTETLKQYVQQLYHFAPDFIATDYESEDWDGLREYVAGSQLEHRNGILAVIDDPTLSPDTKDWRMKLRYPDDYKILLAEVYPGLRHSDYKIEYTVRGFSDVNDIRQVMATQPGKLSLNEMFLLAQSLEPGSQEYDNVFETAVKMYPDDITANLNAANAAMARKDFENAEKYLRKAGDSAQAVYARGVMAALQGDYDQAIAKVEQAMRLGMEDLEPVIELLQDVKTYGKGKNEK